MAHDIIIDRTVERSELYALTLKQAEALCSYESDRVANLANISALLREVFGWFWIGFYRVQGEELVLGPFQGSVACTRIAYGKGVCGTAWAERNTIIVDDVENFPGHIACSSLSRSEIVVPILRDGDVIAVLDIDSQSVATFDNIDKQGLERLCNYIATFI